MKFLVICRALEPPPVGYPDELELLAATQERFRNQTDRRVEQVFSFAGERAFALLIEAATACDLNGSLYGLPAEPLCRFEVHVVVEETDPTGVIIEHA